MTLLDFKKKKSVKSVTVQGFSGPELVIERLFEIGFRKGLQLQLLGNAPFGGPMLVQLNTTVLALRDEESACLLIQEA